jgi:hypothetical protein
MISEKRSRASKWQIAATILGQLLWFAPKSLNQTDSELMTYIGVTRHPRQREFYPAINGFSLSKESVLGQGLLRFSAEAQNSKDLSATWSVSQGAVISTGLFAAPKVVRSQQVTITGTSKEDPGKSAQARKAATPPAPPLPHPLPPLPGTCGPPPYKCSRTDLLPAPLPTTPEVGNLVGAGTCVNDPDFGSKVCRITDSTTSTSTVVSGYGGDGDRNEFNTDSTKLFVEPVNGGIFPMNFDPVTMKATRMYGGWGLKVSSPAWSHVNKDVFYGVTTNPNTAKYLKYDTSGPTIPTPSVVADFTGANCFNGTTPAFVFSAGVSNDDQIFVLGFSDSGGQGGAGAKYVAAYKVGSGCRILNTRTGVISGDWGPTGTVPNWVAMTDADGILLHSLAMSKDGAYVNIVAHPPSCPTCASNGNYFWQMATLNVGQPSGNLGGHITEGYTHWINGAGQTGQFQSRLFTTPGARTTIIPVRKLPTGLVPPFDLHASWNTADPLDTNPFCLTEYKAAHPIPNVAWYKEIMCVSPVNGTVWRFAHTFDTNKSHRFNDLDAIGALSQDGRFYMWSSDWMGTLGSELGSPTCRIGKDCRGDVFVVELK